jgi:hypothetical protein
LQGEGSQVAIYQTFEEQRDERNCKGCGEPAAR